MLRLAALLALALFAVPVSSQADVSFTSNLSSNLFGSVKRDPPAALERALVELFNVAPSGVLTKEQLRNYERSNLAARRSGLMSQTLRFDLNGDGSIDATEITQNLEVVDRGAKAKLIALRYGADTNKDGVLSAAEIKSHVDAQMSKYAKMGGTSNRRKNALFQYDLNGDGTLTVAEIIEVIDLVANTSAETVRKIKEKQGEKERRAARKAKRRAEVEKDSFLETCNFPTRSEKAKVQVMVSGSGLTLSNVALSGLETATTVSSLHIEEGDAPLYLIVSGNGPVIWDFLGTVDRIEQVVTHHGNAVYGLPKEKVHFANIHSCVPGPKTLSDNRTSRPYKKMLQVAFDQERFLIRKKGRIGQYSWPAGKEMLNLYALKKPFKNVSNSGSKATGDERHQYYLTELKNRLRTQYPGGVARIDTEKLVGVGEPVVYPILPGIAGLVQLLESGHLWAGGKRWLNAGEYVIRKPVKMLPHFPNRSGGFRLPGMTIGEGVDLDITQGNLGMYTFYDPETGKCIYGSEVVLDFRPVCSLVKMDQGFI